MSEQCSTRHIHQNTIDLKMAIDQKLASTFASAKEKLDAMRSIYPNLKHVQQVSENFGLLGGSLLVEFLTYESGDPVMPGVTCSKIINTGI